MTSAPAIGFEYVPSRWLPRLLVAVASLSILAVLCSAALMWIKGSLIALVLLMTWRSWKSASTRIVVAVGLSAENDWTLRLASSDDVPALLASFRMLGPFVLLRLRTAVVGQQVILLTPDNSDDDTRRRLRMRLAAMPAAEEVPRV